DADEILEGEDLLAAVAERGAHEAGLRPVAELALADPQDLGDGAEAVAAVRIGGHHGVPSTSTSMKTRAPRALTFTSVPRARRRAPAMRAASRVAMLRARAVAAASLDSRVARRRAVPASQLSR